MGPGPAVFVPQGQTLDVKIKGLFLLYKVEINRDRYLQVNGKKIACSPLESLQALSKSLQTLKKQPTGGALLFYI
jgi:hypothetical protein